MVAAKRSVYAKRLANNPNHETISRSMTVGRSANHTDETKSRN